MKKQPEEHTVKYHKLTKKVFLELQCIKMFILSRIFSLSEMIFSRSCYSSKDYGVAQVYERSLESIYDNSSITPKKIKVLKHFLVLQNFLSHQVFLLLETYRSY